MAFGAIEFPRALFSFFRIRQCILIRCQWRIRSGCYSSVRVLMSVVAGCEACVRLAGNRVHVCRYGAVLCALVRYEGMTEWQTGVNRGVRLSGMPPSAFLFVLRTFTASSVRITYRFIDTKLVWFTFKLKAIDNAVEKQLSDSWHSWARASHRKFLRFFRRSWRNFLTADLSINEIQMGRLTKVK